MDVPFNYNGSSSATLDGEHHALYLNDTDVALLANLNNWPGARFIFKLEFVRGNTPKSLKKDNEKT